MGQDQRFIFSPPRPALPQEVFIQLKWSLFNPRGTYSTRGRWVYSTRGGRYSTKGAFIQLGHGGHTTQGIAHPAIQSIHPQVESIGQFRQLWSNLFKLLDVLSVLTPPCKLPTPRRYELNPRRIHSTRGVFLEPTGTYSTRGVFTPLNGVLIRRWGSIFIQHGGLCNSRGY